MVGELAAERPLDNRFLESADGGLELLVRNGPLVDKLVENLGRDRRQRRLRRRAFRFAVHRHSSCYAPHTKFLTPSGEPPDSSPLTSLEHFEQTSLTGVSLHRARLG